MPKSIVNVIRKIVIEYYRLSYTEDIVFLNVFKNITRYCNSHKEFIAKSVNDNSHKLDCVISIIAKCASLIFDDIVPLKKVNYNTFMADINKQFDSTIETLIDFLDNNYVNAPCDF